jgi:hypothetical protein
MKKSGKDKIPMERKELIEEHAHLVGVLRSPNHEDDKKEAKKQAKELAGYKTKSVKHFERLQNYVKK